MVVSDEFVSVVGRVDDKYTEAEFRLFHHWARLFLVLSEAHVCSVLYIDDHRPANNKWIGHSWSVENFFV